MRSYAALVLPPSESAPDEVKSERQRSRMRKRKVNVDALSKTREELFNGNFDAYASIVNRGIFLK